MDYKNYKLYKSGRHHGHLNINHQSDETQYLHI